MPHQTLTIDLLRHGEPEGGPMYRGSTDRVLTAEGWEQMENALRLADGMSAPWQRVIYSPLLRCKEFAKKLGDQYGLPHKEIDDLREIHFGDWEGRSFKEVNENESDAVRKFWEDPVKNTPPNGEPIIALHDRVTNVWSQLQQDHADEHLLIVAHGGVIRAIMCHVLGMPLESIQRVTVPYACLTQIKIYQSLQDPEQQRDAEKKQTAWQQLVFHQGSYLTYEPQVFPGS